MIRECGSVVFARRGLADEPRPRTAWDRATCGPWLLLCLTFSHPSLIVASGLTLELVERSADPRTPVTTTGPLDGQLVTASLPELVVLGSINRFGLGQDLVGELLTITIREERRVRCELAAIDRNHTGIDQTSFHTQPEDLTEHPSDRGLMTTPESGQRGVIRTLDRGQHPIGDIFNQTPFDPSRRALARAIRVHQYPQHHRRVIHRPAPTIDTRLAIERRQVELCNHVKSKPPKMVLRQSISHRRRHQMQLLPIPTTHVHGHHQFAPANPYAGGDGRDSCDSLRSAPAITTWCTKADGPSPWPPAESPPGPVPTASSTRPASRSIEHHAASETRPSDRADRDRSAARPTPQAIANLATSS